MTNHIASRSTLASDGAKGPFHIGRGWHGHEAEDACPCPQQVCGLVDERDIVDDCPQHAIKAAKTIRQMHRAATCLPCSLAEILDEYLLPDVDWRAPDFDPTPHMLTQSTCLLAAAVLLREVGVVQPR